MKTSVIHTTETVDGKEYPLTVTRQVGEQEIKVDGKSVRVVGLTVFESSLGQSSCYTRAQPELAQSERAAGRRQIQETATQAMLDQGIW